jgi:hypothetical protein
MDSSLASGLLVVALHDVVALDADLAGHLVALDGLARVVGELEAHAPDGEADGARLLGLVEHVEARHGRGLREAVALEDVHAVLLVEGGHHLDRHRRASGHAVLEGAGVVLVGALESGGARSTSSARRRTW